MPHLVRDFAIRALPFAVVALLPACGQQQGGGFQGFPPAEVTTLAGVRAVDRWARECSLEIARGVELKV